MGGTELNAVRTAERLDRHRVAVEVAAMQPDGPLRARYDEAGIPVTVFPIANLYGPGAWRQGLRLASWLRRRRPDVVHCHDIYSNIFVGFWARMAGIRNVIASRRWGASSSKPSLDALNRIMSRRATRLLVNSSAVGTTLVRQEGYPSERISIIPNFLEPAAFASPDPNERARRQAALGIPSDRWIVGIVARLSAVKNHALLLHAVRRLTAGGRPVHIVIVGDGPTRTGLEQLAQSLKLADSLTFTGTLPNRPNPHELFDLSVLTSRSEGFPNAVVEAMAAGRPVVATDVGGVRDAVSDGVTGLLVPSDDEAALAAAIERLREDPARAEAMGQAGRKAAMDRFSQEVVLNQLTALYEELAR
ncbi:MAG TPA: glycosyltransferase [Gemmatimonadales bacterium]|nr:glycosyltransferase [Gemmatimonadales bacterium]